VQRSCLLRARQGSKGACVSLQPSHVVLPPRLHLYDCPGLLALSPGPAHLRAPSHPSHPRFIAAQPPPILRPPSGHCLLILRAVGAARGLLSLPGCVLCSFVILSRKKCHRFVDGMRFSVIRLPIASRLLMCLLLCPTAAGESNLLVGQAACVGAAATLHIIRKLPPVGSTSLGLIRDAALTAGMG
jgi:hypothetical protein